MIIRAGRIGLFADGKRVGSHLISSNILNIKLNGKKFRILFSPVSGITIYLGFKVAAKMSGGVLEYGGEKYRISETVSESGNVPCIVRDHDNTVVAASKGDRSVETFDECDPVVMVFAIMAICLSNYVSRNGMRTHSDFYRIKLQERKSNISVMTPLVITVGTIFFILLAQVYNAPPWSTLLITVYAGLLISTVVVLILYSYLSRIDIYNAFNDNSRGADNNH